MKPKALILLSNASGTTPETLNPFIEEFVGKDIPVFLLSRNYARETGIQKITYGAQAEAVKAGAIPLKDVNVNGTLRVVDAIQKAASEGLNGKRLNDAIITQFGTVAERPAK